MMALARDVLSTALVVLGALFFTAGTVGLLRFPDVLCRLHAVSKADGAGLGLVALGLLLRAESVAAALKVLVVWVLALVASAASGQLVGRFAARASGRERPWTRD
ncbi:monovalent cation/H(+) antiporter subunit G [Myxococcus sp. AM009]|uniref:cation:proton antiporter n=1 Tax=unclassified Myxococcus TaxID=2648731 RepID=UPI001594FB4D|nr:MULTISPECIES: monovalent cation/H(+) antiporter subunit G [unclassified Myxococcus]NVJ01081.1 monovalent cation/H(+) antiporter subunit G [Myxococcus sp. AM009]NVJ18600.1 monovalent cation/H(+) antiporter subunit G [Myxococcus sp. AM010]